MPQQCEIIDGVVYDATLKSQHFKGFSVSFSKILPVIRAVKEVPMPYSAGVEAKTKRPATRKKGEKSE